MCPTDTREVKIKVGDRIPQDVYFGVLDENSTEPRRVTAEDLFSDKRVVLFGIPGAFTNVCSSKDLPDFLQFYEKFKEKSIDIIACVAINDPYVMREWGNAKNVDDKILMLSDGDMTFHSVCGLLQKLPYSGERGRRFSMFVDDGVVKLLNVEEPGALNYTISTSSILLENLEEMEK
ncbi:hypothetical protein G9A89_016822 [Geosiphon pyriformis]|nr:hypothetical protein G9A89_016822 [Geosiphon pyriformis]